MYSTQCSTVRPDSHADQQFLSIEILDDSDTENSMAVEVVADKVEQQRAIEAYKDTCLIVTLHVYSTDILIIGNMPNG
jgi:hypothetical protein